MHSNNAEIPPFNRSYVDQAESIASGRPEALNPDESPEMSEKAMIRILERISLESQRSADASLEQAKEAFLKAKENKVVSDRLCQIVAGRIEVLKRQDEVLKRQEEALKAAMPQVTLISNDEHVRCIVESVLAGQSYSTLSYNDGLSFMEGLSKGDKPPHAILLEAELPYFTGIQLLSTIRKSERWSKVPVLFISPDAESEDISKAFAEGADDFINKPINTIELTTRLKKLLKKEPS